MQLTMGVRQLIRQQVWQSFKSNETRVLGPVGTICCAHYSRRGSKMKFGLGLLTSLVAGSLASAQESVIIQGKPSCPSCTIEQKLLARFGSPNDTIQPGVFSSIVRDSRGRHFVPSNGSNVVIVYDSLGRFLTTVGRPGQGPGEFESIGSIVVGPKDTLYVFDNGDYSVFSPDFKLIRTAALPPRVLRAPTVLPGGILVMLSSEVLPTAYRSRIVVMDAKTVITTAVVDELGADRGCAACASADIRVDRSGSGFWTAPENRYEMQLRTLSATVQRRLTVQNSPWFSPFTSTRIEGNAKLTSLYRVDEDPSGRIWTTSYIAGARPPGPNPPPPGTRYLVVRKDTDSTRLHDRATRYTTVIEVLDIAGKSVFVSQRLAGQYLPMGPGLGYKHSIDSDGFISIEVYSWSIRRP
jgi:hypothetical protein